MWAWQRMVGSMSRRIFHDWSWSRYLGLLMVATILLTFMPGVFVLGSPTSDTRNAENQSDQSDRINPVSSDALFMGSATILGLATFGSLLGLMSSSIHKYGKAPIYAVGIASALIVIFSTWLMHFACCQDTGPLETGVPVILIGAAAFAIIATTAYIIEKRSQNTDSSNNL